MLVVKIIKCAKPGIEVLRNKLNMRIVYNQLFIYKVCQLLMTPFKIYIKINLVRKNMSKTNFIIIRKYL